MNNYPQQPLVVLILTIIGSFSIFGQGVARFEATAIDPELDFIVRGEVRILDENGSVIDSKQISGKESIFFDELKPGKITVEVESPGFELFRKEVVLEEGTNRVTARLEIKQIEANVEVEQSEIDKRLSRAFSGVLSQEEIDSLPDNSQEIEKELKRRYGDDLMIRINGFAGGQIPPKEMIRSIQVSRSSFDAEFHELGKPNINIITKASIPKLVGMVMFNYGNSALNARNAFAREKFPQQNRMVMGFLSGPINNKSSFIVSYNDFSRSRDVNVFTSGTSGLSSIDETSTSSRGAISADLNYDVASDHTLRFGALNSESNLTNAGIGGFNLLERGFDVKSENNEFKVSWIGTLNKRFTQQFRSRYSNSYSKSVPNSTNIGITVAGAFNAGGSGVDHTSMENKFELFEIISFGARRHFIKLGGELHFENRKIISSDGTNGNFFFRNILDYSLRQPSTFTRIIGKNDFSFNRNDFALFVQDDFRIAKRMQIGFGLRYENQTGLDDGNNFSPRLSAALVLDEKAKFVIRSGAGILYQWHDSETIERIRSNDGSQNSELVVINPGFPSPADGGVLLKPLPPSVYRQAANLVNPYIFVAQIGINMNLGEGLKFDASYKFERGINMFRSRDINAPIDEVRPNSNFGRIRALESSGRFSRNSIELSGTGVLFKRVRANARYRLNKTTDDFEGTFGLPVDNYDLSIEKGTSSSDQRHQITGSFDYSPFRDFRLNPSFVIGSPFPYTITTGIDNNGDTVFNDRPPGVSRNTERGRWSKNFNFAVNWSFPIFKRSNGNEKSESSNNLPDILKFHKLNLSINVNNIFNSTNLQDFIGNQLSPFFRQATSSAPARSFNVMFLYF